MFLDLVPHSVEVSSGGVVSSDVVGGVGDPEGGRGSVGLEHSGGLDCADGQVVPDDVVGLDAILDEEVVSLDIVSDIVFDSQVVHSVDGDDSGV